MSKRVFFLILAPALLFFLPLPPILLNLYFLINLKDEYVKAYYAALIKKQQELDEAAKKQHELSNTHALNGISGMTSNRQVGMKSKRDEDDGDDDVEWEEAPVAGINRFIHA
jgi:hypothetical protein